MLRLRVWDSSWAMVAWKDKAIWESSFREKMHSLSKNTPTGDGSSPNIRTVLMQSTTFLAKRETLLVRIRSIFQALQSVIIWWNCSRWAMEVPLIPSSA